MTTLMRWQANIDPDQLGGMATFTFGDRMLQVRLESFADARAIDELIDLVALRSRRAARVACANYVRAAATHLEHSE